MALTNDDIQSRNKKLQGEYGTLKSNRAELLSAIGATAPKVSSYGGMVPSVNFAPGQEAARTDYQSQLADNDKAMWNFTARAQQLTKDAKTFTDATRAKLYAANTGVPLKYQNSAPSASASTGAAAGATAPAGGQPTNTGFVSGRVTRGSADPMFKNTVAGTGIAPGDAPANPVYKSPFAERNAATAALYGNPAPAPVRTVNLGAGNFNNSGAFGGAYADTGSAATPQAAVRPQPAPQPAATGYTKDFFTNTDGQAPAAAAPQPKVANAAARATPYGGGPVRTDLASSIDKNGVPTFDNDSIARLIKRNGGDAVPPTGAAAQSAAAPIYNAMPTGPTGSGIGAVIRAEDPNVRALSDINQTIDRLSQNPNMRSKRDMLVQALAMRNGFLNQQNQIASTEGIAAQSRAAELARTGMTESGADRRNTATLQNQMAVEGLRQNGDTYRTLLGAMPRPQYTVDSNGNYVQINGATSTPVLGNDGSPLKLPQNNEAANDKLKAMSPLLAEALKGANAQAMDPTASPEERSDAKSRASAILQMAGIGGQQGAQANAPTVTTKAQFDALKSGDTYIGTDGKQYRKP